MTSQKAWVRAQTIFEDVLRMQAYRRKMPELVFTWTLNDSRSAGLHVNAMPHLGIDHETFYFPIWARDYLVWLHADESLGERA